MTPEQLDKMETDLAAAFATAAVILDYQSYDTGDRALAGTAVAELAQARLAAHYANQPAGSGAVVADRGIIGASYQTHRPDGMR